MPALGRDRRRELERTVREARRAAEAGARRALESLAVGGRKPWDTMTATDRALRNRLRAHGRQLGDRRDPATGAQAVTRLVRECAYAHWHRMLFARFLAEAGLLIEPESGVAVTVDEARELAHADGKDWLALAGAWARRMLPQIFRAGDPVLDVALAPETRQELESLLEGLPRETFLADDSLGWVYQFWQGERKAEVNRAGGKIGADELPAVTQLFTEDYMVLFLLHNTLGAWWAGKVLRRRPELADSAADEDELREACAVGDVDWRYLRFVREPGQGARDGPWRPAGGAFEGWPGAAKDLTLCDPCMGSGHFLVFALPILVAFRMAEEELSRAAAADAVLRDNLFGLEIDPRCTQIAAFALAFAAWRMGGHRPLPPLNLACSGLAIGVGKAEWLRLAERASAAADPEAKRDLFGTEETLLTAGVDERMRNGLAALYDLFARAPALGSLIDPRRVEGDVFREGFGRLEPLLSAILAAADSDDTREMAVAARGMAAAAALLGRRFTLAATNVPYLGRGKQHAVIADHLLSAFSDARSDLATAMLRRLVGFAAGGGTVAAVTPQNWLFLKSYARLRERLLRETTLNAVATLGPRAFETIGGEVVNVALVAVTASPAPKGVCFAGLDANDGADAAAKALALSEGSVALPTQAEQNGNPDRRISVGRAIAGPLLQKYASSYQGISPADFPMFGRLFWEGFSEGNFRFWQSTVKETALFSGKSLVLWCGRYLEEAVRGKRAYVRGESAWERAGISVSQMRQLPVTISTGEAFDTNGAVIVPKDPDDLPAIWAFCSNPEYRDAVRRIDRKLNVTNATLVKVPFDLDFWRQVAEELWPDGLPKPHSSDPTQWLFDGRPAGADSPLHVAVARLAGYRWPRQTGTDFMDCPAVEADGLERHVDEDGIVCLPALRGEPPAADRLAALLADSFRADWSAAKLAGLLADAGFAGKGLDDWLRDGFFKQHCGMFRQRPFVWHIWDGRRDGFHALLDYHRLAAPGGEGRRTLEKLVYSYLGDWIARQKTESSDGAEGADARLAHAERLSDELKRILEGEPPYDIFARWKPLREQPVGWEPDIDDGVRINIRPFTVARPLGARAKNACILRVTPNVKWKKDRGREPARDETDYPWFWGWDETTADFAGGAAFDGNRWNDLHYTRAFKHAARARAEGGKKR